MDNRLRVQTTAGLAVLSISTAMAFSAAPPAAASPVQSDATTLVGSAQTLSPAATLSPPGLIGQQIAFNVGFVTTFLSTGAQLFARELPIPLTLVANVANGTPLPTAVVGALRDFATVEVDAGKALVGFGAEYVRFQTRFVTGHISGQSAVAPAAVQAARPAVESARNNSTSRHDAAALSTTTKPANAGGLAAFRGLRHLADQGHDRGLGQHRHHG